MSILTLTWIRLYPFDAVETCVAMRILCEKHSTWLYAKDFYAREIPTLTNFFSSWSVLVKTRGHAVCVEVMWLFPTWCDFREVAWPCSDVTFGDVMWLRAAARTVPHTSMYWILKISQCFTLGLGISTDPSVLFLKKDLGEVLKWNQEISPNTVWLVVWDIPKCGLFTLGFPKSLTFQNPIGLDIFFISMGFSKQYSRWGPKAYDSWVDS